MISCQEDVVPKEEAGGDPMGRSGGVKGDLFLWHIPIIHYICA